MEGGDSGALLVLTGTPMAGLLTLTELIVVPGLVGRWKEDMLGRVERQGVERALIWSAFSELELELMTDRERDVAATVGDWSGL